MGYVLAAIKFVTDIIEWFTNRSQRQIGMEEQQNADATKTIQQLEAEQNASAQHYDSVDELSKHDF